jgi:hypothetical protein
LVPDADPNSWQVLKITPDGQVTLFAQGAPLRVPNGIAIDRQGNIVVANSGDAAILTFSPNGRLERTEQAAQAGSDGLVIMADGTKYISSVFNGGVTRIAPGGAAELIAQNIPSAASICYDAGANQLVIPMNDQNGLAFIRLGPAGDRPSTPAAPALSQEALLDLSRTKWRWMAEQRVDSLAALFHDEAVFVHMGGTMRREQELDIIRTGGIRYTRAEIFETSVRMLEGTAVVLSRIRLDAVVGGNSVTNPFMVTEVYVQQRGRWKLGGLTFTRLLQ